MVLLALLGRDDGPDSYRLVGACFAFAVLFFYVCLYLHADSSSSRYWCCLLGGAARLGKIDSEVHVSNGFVSSNRLSQTHDSIPASFNTCLCAMHRFLCCSRTANSALLGIKAGAFFFFF
jgi:hypothetical protein